MKHIKKKLLIEKTDVNREDLPGYKFIEDVDKGIDHKTLHQAKGSIVLIENQDNKMFGGFVEKINGINYVLPMPDPTLIYFHNAKVNFRSIAPTKKILLEKLDVRKASNNIPVHELYNYYCAASGVIINLFTCMESFTNQSIPSDYLYKKSDSKKTEIFNSKQIMEYVDFKTKVKVILPEIFGKSFFNHPTSANSLIDSLKEFRDQIIHTKPDAEDLIPYQQLIRKSMNFQYEKSIDAVFKFINFYKPNYIEECDCGEDF